jgi:hypothetical protein
MPGYLIVALALLGSAMGDDGYAAPANSGYGAPAASYGAPTAPADNYGVPSYGEPTGYTAPAEPAGGDLFNLDKILELVPFFLAVFAAIIIAQLFAPLLGLLFDAKVGLLAPFGTAKIDLINLVLAPLNLSLCTLNPLAAATGRDHASGFSLNPDVLNAATTFLQNALNKYEE